MMGSKTVLGAGKKMVLGKIAVQLLLYHSLYQFGDDGDDGDGPEVGWVRGITGFMDRVNDGVFPGRRNFGEKDRGVDEMKDDIADSGETGFQQADKNSIVSAGRRAAHGHDDPSQGGDVDGRQSKGTGANARESAAKVRASALGGDFVCDFRTDRYEKAVEVATAQLWLDLLCFLLPSDNAAQVSPDCVGTLFVNALVNVLASVTADGRPHSLVQVTVLTRASTTGSERSTTLSHQVSGFVRDRWS